MYSSKLYPEIRSIKKARFQDKLMQLFFIGAISYVLGIATVLWVLVK